MLGAGRTEGALPRRRHPVEQILVKLREAAVALSKGQSVAHVCRALRLTDQPYHRWRNEYGGLKVDHVTRRKELERETICLKRAGAARTLDTLILTEAAEGNVYARRADGRPWSPAVRRGASPNAEWAGYWGSPAPRNGSSGSRPMTTRR